MNKAVFIAWRGGGEDAGRWFPLAILGVTEGIRQTDALEVFPRPLPDAQGRYCSRFFLHGLRRASAAAQARVAAMRPEDRLAIEVEDDNRFDPRAVAVLSNGQTRLKLGYVPRYLARDVRGLIAARGLDAIDVRVARVNTGAPLQMRLLCSLTTPWPENFEPCAEEEFLPLGNDRVVELAASGA